MPSSSTSTAFTPEGALFHQKEIQRMSNSWSSSCKGTRSLAGCWDTTGAPTRRNTGPLTKPRPGAPEPLTLEEGVSPTSWSCCCGLHSRLYHWAAPAAPTCKKSKVVRQVIVAGTKNMQRAAPGGSGSPAPHTLGIPTFISQVCVAAPGPPRWRLGEGLQHSASSAGITGA